MEPISTPITPSTRCYFLEIPPELRLRIYKFVYGDVAYALDLCVWNTRLLTPAKYKTPLGRSRRNRKRASLLRTCKTINTEAGPVLYDRVYCTFFIDWQQSPNARDLGPIVDCRFFQHLRSYAVCADWLGCQGEELLNLVDQFDALFAGLSKANQDTLIVEELSVVFRLSESYHDVHRLISKIAQRDWECPWEVKCYDSENRTNLVLGKYGHSNKGLWEFVDGLRILLEEQDGVDGGANRCGFC